MADFKEVTKMRYWCQKVLPLVYDDSLSYYELLGKIVNKLNDLIENNEQLPEYISNLIQQYISSGAIGEVVRDILTNFMLNVKNPPNDLKPAVGDGSADDTEAIQGCIDYASANGGMCVYFPSGSYLTKPLTIKENVSLFGFDRYNTKLVLRGGATQALLTGNVKEVSISGMTLDGNMDIQVNNINLIDMNVESAILSNLVLTDGYKLVRVTVNKILQMDNLIFDYSVIKHLELSGSGSVSANNIYMHDISALKGECLLELQNNNSTFTNMFALGDTPLGYKIAGNNNSISGVIRNAIVPYTDTGTNNSITILGVTENIKMTGDSVRSNNNSTETSKGQKTINAENIKLNPTQPLEYKEPVALDEYFKTIPFKHGNENYDVLVKGGKGVKEAIEKVATDLTAETLARQEADNALNTSIGNEELARQNADNALSLAIDNEELARQNADNILDTVIRQETENRQAKDLELEDEIATKVTKQSKIFNLKDFGAKGDGVTDDTLAIKRWVASFVNNSVGYIPVGTYIFKETINIPNLFNFTLRGEGESSVFLFDGDGNVDIDLIVFGNTNLSKGVLIKDFNISSKKQMTAGYALKVRYVKFNSSVVNVNFYNLLDSSSKTLYNGIAFDTCNGVYYNNFSISVKNKAVTIWGSSSADITLDKGIITYCKYGIHVGGGFGGLYTQQLLMFHCDTAILINNELLAEMNREFFFNNDTIIDGTGNVGVMIDDSLAFGGTIKLQCNIGGAGAVNSSQTADNVIVNKWDHGRIIITGSEIRNATRHGLVINDSEAYVILDDSVTFDYNQGDAIKTVTTSRLYDNSVKYQNGLNYVNGTFTNEVPRDYTPTVNSGTGTLGSANGSVKWYQRNGVVEFTAEINVIETGTGGFSLNFLLPVVPLTDSIVMARNKTNGVACLGVVTAGVPQCSIFTTDGLYPATDNTTFTVSGSLFI